MIGPVYPYRGGIAQYTSLMVKELSKKHNVTTISYKLQYPKFLSRRSTQKDHESEIFRVSDTHYLINTINPISYLKTVRFIKAKLPDVVIVQWWNPFFAFAYRSILGHIEKHCKVIILCHNILPHDKLPLRNILTRMALKKGDAYIVHSKSDSDKLLQVVPDAKYVQTVHPTYDVFNANNVCQADAREKLHISPDSQTLLFFGFVRKYKGLEYLLKAMPIIIEALPKCMLLVVGDILESEKEDYMQYIKATGCEKSIKLVSNYVPDSEVECYFAACDLVILPYLSATQSGIVQIAYGFNKPVIATNVGGLPDVVLDGVTGYLVPPCDHEALADAAIHFFKDGKADEFKKNIEAEAHRFSWARMAEIVEELALL